MSDTIKRAHPPLGAQADRSRSPFAFLFAAAGTLAMGVLGLSLIRGSTPPLPPPPPSPPPPPPPPPPARGRSGSRRVVSWAPGFSFSRRGESGSFSACPQK